MIKYNGKVIENTEMAQEFVDSFKTRLIRIGIAFVVSIIALKLAMRFMVTESDWAALIFGLIIVGNLLIIGLDKLIYLLSLLKVAWFKGWNSSGLIVERFLKAYICALFVIGCVITFYGMLPFVGVIISGVSLVITYFRTKRMLEMGI